MASGYSRDQHEDSGNSYSSTARRHPYRPTGGNPKNNRAQGRMQEHPYRADGGNPYRKPRHYLSKKTVAVIVEAILAVIAVCVFVLLYSSSRSADKNAERFFVYIVNGDYDKAYALTNLQDDTFVNADEFGHYLETSGEDYSDVVNVSVTSQDNSTSYGNNANGRSFLGNLFSFTSDSSNSQSEENIKTVYITFRREGYQTDDYIQILMVNEGKQGWVMNGSIFLSQDLSVTVKKGATAEIDGIKIPEDDLSESGDTYDTYVIKTLFSGEHDFKAVLEGYKDYEEQFSDNYVNAEDMAYTDESVKKAEDKAVEAMSVVYQSAVSGDDFSSVSSLFAVSDAGLKDIYENMADYYRQDDKKLNSLKISNIEASGNGNLDYVSISYSFASSYSYKNWDDEWENGTEESNDDITVEMILENGEWVVQNFPFQRIGL